MLVENDEPLIVLTDADIPPQRTNSGKEKRMVWVRANWIAIAAAGISLVSAGISGWQAYLSSSSARESKEQFIQTQRPVLELEGVKLPVVILTAQGQLTYIVSLDADNKGNSPALNSILMADIRIDQEQTNNPLLELNKTCTSLDNLGPVAGSVAPQSTKTPFSRQPVQKSADIITALDKATPDKDGTRHLNTRMAMCIRYDDRFSKTTHHEGQLYDLAINVTQLEYMLIKAKQDVLLKAPDSLSYFQPMHFFNGLSD